MRLKVAFEHHQMRSAHAVAVYNAGIRNFQTFRQIVYDHLNRASDIEDTHQIFRGIRNEHGLTPRS